MKTVAKEHAPTSGEFFRLLSRMLNHANHYGTSIQGVDKLLEVELNWLLKVRVSRLSACLLVCVFFCGIIRLSQVIHNLV